MTLPNTISSNSGKLSVPSWFRSAAMRFTVALLAVAAVALAPEFANAGCPRVCEITHERVTVEPSLECMSTIVYPGECFCALTVQFYNQCELPIEALDFEFFTSDDTVLQPGRAESTGGRIDGDGHFEWIGLVGHNGQVHEVVAEVDVSNYGGGCAGPCGSTGSAAAPSVWLTAGMAFGIVMAAGSRIVRRSSKDSFGGNDADSAE